ncbi:PEP-CTERM sorting domain-containing protein [Thalassotalea piscium]
MKNILLASLLCLAALTTTKAQATLITADSLQTNYQVGDSIAVLIDIKEIEYDNFGFQKLLALFNFEIGFNENVLAFDSITFGNKLDVDPDPFYASLKNVSQTASSKLTVEEISLALSNDLFFAQDGLASFNLVTINFTALMSGMSDITLSNVKLADDFGNSFMEINSVNTKLTIGNIATVPEPSTLSLLLLVLAAGLVVSQRKSQGS